MNRRPPAALLLPLLALAACKDTAGPGPEPSLSVRLTASAEPPVLGTGSEGEPTIECVTHFDAVGEGAGQAVWAGGILRYFSGVERTVAVDSIPFDGAEMHEALGKPGIGAGEAQRVSWRIRGVLPYSAELEVRYTQGGRQGSARARAACGPAPDPSLPAPTVSGASITFPAAGVEPGDSVTVSWTATAPGGLWETGVIVAGVEARTRVASLGGTSVVPSVRVEVPHAVGVPMQVEVYVLDSFGRRAAAPLSTPIVEDRTPPVVDRARIRGDAQFSLVGQFGVGDLIPLDLMAVDNFGLTHVVYGVGTARDSVPLSGRFHNGVVRLPVRATWVGRSDFFVQVRDAGGNLSPRLEAERMGFYPVHAAQATHASLPDEPTQAVIHEGRGRGWVRFRSRPELRAYTLPSLALARTVTLPAPAADMDLSVSGDTLVAAVGASLALVDARADYAVTLVPLTGVQQVTGLRVSAAGEAVVLATMQTGRWGLLAYTLATGEQRVLNPDLQLWGFEGQVARSLDRRRMVVGRGCAYDAVEHRMGVCVGSIPGIGSLAGDRTGSRWALDGRVYDGDLGLVLEIPRPDHANGASLSPSGQEVLFNTSDGPLRVRVADGSYLERFGGISIAEGIVGSGDGSFVLRWGFWPENRLTYVSVP